MKDTFLLDYYADIEVDVFGKSIAKSYKSMLKKLAKKQKRLDKVSKEFDLHCEENNLEIGSEEWVLHYEFFDDLVELQVKTDSIRERLSSVGEMQIVYLHKCVEISIKNMLRDAYNANYEWKDDKITALEKRGIDTKSLDGYSEINTLRLVNNKIKHSENLHSELNASFSEFSNTHSFLDYEDFDLFYKKTIPFCSFFLKSIKDNIISSLSHSPTISN